MNDYRIGIAVVGVNALLWIAIAIQSWRRTRARRRAEIAAVERRLHADAARDRAEWNRAFFLNSGDTAWARIMAAVDPPEVTR